MIEIKAYVGDWREVTPQKAYEFVQHLRNGMPAVKEQDKNRVINEKHLRGITVEELMQNNT